MANTVINTPELLNLDSTTGATILAKGTISERPSIPTFNADYLVIAGGGGGGGGRGGNATVWSAGGGGGGYQYSTGIKLLIDTNYTITVGAGGAGGAGNGTPISSDGENSSIVASGIINEVATGGIGGGKSAGGAGGASGSLPSNSGGTSYSAGAYWGGGGGAGIGSNGSNGSSSSAGAGGNGLQFSITGTATYYSGGGGGGIYQLNTGGSGGLGGGGNGKGTTANGDNGLVNTGGGGGAAGSTGGSGGVNFTGGTGGSGIVILRYPNSYTINIGAGLTSSTITDGSEKVTSFTAGAGTITFSGATSSNSDEYPIDGTLRFNTETNKTEYYDGTGWYEIVDEYASGFIGPATNYFDTKLYTGNGATQSIGGYINGSASFNGSSSKIDLNSLSTVLDAQSIVSVSFWFKSSSTALSGLFSYRGSASSAVNMLVALNRSATGDVGLDSSTSGAFVNLGTYNGTYNDDNWHHVVSTINYSTGAFNVYIDNTLRITGTNTSLSRGTADKVQLGTNYGAQFINGSLDQVRIYDTALSSSDVTALYGETAATASTAAFPSGQTAIATYTMDTSANGLLNTQDLSTVNYPAGAGCIALYEMNGNSNDTSGTYNGTPANITYQGGAFDQAAVFNGLSSSIVVPNASKPSLSTASVSLWVKTTSTNPQGLVGDNISGNHWGNLHLYINNNKLVGRSGNASNANNPEHTSVSNVNTGLWVHCVVTITGNTQKIYINGVLENTATLTVTRAATTSPFSIGQIYVNGSIGQTWTNDCDIDQVRIFNTVLTQTQVTTLARGIATSYSGAATNVNFNGHLDFAPDFVWIKSRTFNDNHNIADTVRGATKYIFPNSNSNEFTSSTYLNRFSANGFSIGSDNSGNKIGENFVSWNWKAGGAAVTNNNGTIASQVSANKDSGFSIVKYTTQASGTGTVGHGLANPPEIVIVKTTGVLDSWRMYHSSLGAGYQIYLNLVNSAGPTTNQWNNTAPTSSVFSLGTDNAGNYASMAYCWHSVAGYSKTGSYSGTGVSGKEVALDFNPGFVLIKRTNASTGWIIVDDQRGTKELYPNLSNAEDTTTTNIVLGTNKFTLNTTGSWYNASGGNYLYMAFA
jgi:hypothetical protein